MVSQEEQTVSLTYFLGLGSNLGNRIQNLVNALMELGTHGNAIAVSAVYETEPVGGPKQDYYLNMACALETLLEPIELLHLAKTIELQLGRQEGERWGISKGGVCNWKKARVEAGSRRAAGDPECSRVL